MKAIRLHQHGGVDAMRLEELPLPEPGPGQVLVEVKAAGVNLFDTQLRSGLYKRDLPLTLGLEGAGVVQALRRRRHRPGSRRPRRLDFRPRLRHAHARIGQSCRAVARCRRLCRGRRDPFPRPHRALSRDIHLRARAGIELPYSFGGWRLRRPPLSDRQNSRRRRYRRRLHRRRKPKSPARPAPTTSSSTRKRTSRPRSSVTPTAAASTWSMMPSASTRIFAA